MAPPYAHAMDRDRLYIRLWLVWVAILTIGIGYVLVSLGALSWL